MDRYLRVEKRLCGVFMMRENITGRDYMRRERL